MTAFLDLLIRGARVLDGSGGPARDADVGVAGDRIVAVERLDGATAAIELAGHGLAIAPGFVDMHTHFDLALEWPGLTQHLLRQGITTVVGGNCGIGDPDVASTLARAEGARLGVNAGQLAPYGPIRSRVVPRGESRPARADEAERIARAVEEALDAGALGLSFGPYEANALASLEELARAARVLGPRGAPFVVHRRDEGARALEATEEAIAIARYAGCRLQISHLKVAGRLSWPSFDGVVAAIQAARRQDDVACDVYPYSASLTYLNAILPSTLKADGRLAERLATAPGRQDARAAAERWFTERQPADKIVLVAPADPRVRRGSTLVEAAKTLGIADPAEAALAIIASDPKAEGGWAIYRDMMKAEHVEQALELEGTAIASDSVPEDDGTPAAHPRCYGTFARALARAAKKGEPALADAVRRATSLPCERLNLRARGRLDPGAAADLVLFDPAKLRDAATDAEPDRYPEGIAAVVVAGRVAFRDGRVVEGHAGRVLRG